MINPYKYIYGPVYSWRLGRSLGVDPLSMGTKICNMNCIYCQLGKTAHLTHDRSVYLTTQSVVDEIKSIPLHFVDYITFSGRGEPTLAQNLGDMIRAVKKVRHEKIAVITNGILMGRVEVQEDLLEADFVLVKLDAGNQVSFELIDKARVDFNAVIEGIISFRGRYQGKMALQIMVMAENLNQMEAIATLARTIAPDEIQLNTPLRPSGVLPIARFQMEKVKSYFNDMTVVTVFDSPAKPYAPIDEPATVSRHGNFQKTRSYI